MLKKILDKLTFKPDPIQLYSSGMTDVGQRRNHNEDSYLIDEKLGLFIVADGMGGHEEGEVASKLAVETIFNHIKKLDNVHKQNNTSKNSNTTKVIKSILQDAVEDANNQTHCYNIAKGVSEGKGMGTTVTGFLMSSPDLTNKKKLYSFNVGDSRTYSFRKGQLNQLTTDHSHYQLWLETGKEGPPPKHNIIYKAIGPWRRIVAEQHTFPIRSNELFLLCSDGLCDMLSNKEICDILYKNRKKSLKEITHVLVESANKAGGKDNITVILVKPEIHIE